MKQINHVKEIVIDEWNEPEFYAIVYAYANPGCRGCEDNPTPVPDDVQRKEQNRMNRFLIVQALKFIEENDLEGDFIEYVQTAIVP